MQNGLVEIYTWICDTSVLASIRRSAECQQVGAAAIYAARAGRVARGLGLQLLVLMLVLLMLFMLELLLLQLRKAGLSP